MTVLNIGLPLARKNGMLIFVLVNFLYSGSAFMLTTASWLKNASPGMPACTQKLNLRQHIDIPLCSLHSCEFSDYDHQWL